MTYEIWVEIYWAIVFVIRDFTFTMMAIIAVLGILRPIKLYAFAQPIIINNDWFYSSFLMRIGWRLIYKLGLIKDDDDMRRDYGAHIFGTGLDLGVTLVLGLICSFLWPVALIIALGIVPLQAMHTRYARKLEFMSRLKGETVT